MERPEQLPANRDASTVDHACKKNPPYSGPQFPHLLIEGTCSPLQTPVAVKEENYSGCGFSPTALSTV